MKKTDFHIVEITSPTKDEATQIAYAVVSITRKTWVHTYPNTLYGISVNDIDENFRAFSDHIATTISYLLYNSVVRHYWIAKIKGAIVGFCVCIQEPQKGHVEAVYVLPHMQSRGIGSALFEAGLAWLSHNNVIDLSVAMYNKKAIDLYTRYGFVTTGRSVYILDNIPSIKYIPTYIMTKQL